MKSIGQIKAEQETKHSELFKSCGLLIKSNKNHSTMENTNTQPDFTANANKHRDCTHELKQGEIWVGNTDVINGLNIPEHLIGKMKTARLGEQAYDINGKPIEIWYCRPLIIHQSEELIYDKIMMELLKKARRGE